MAACLTLPTATPTAHPQLAVYNPMRVNSVGYTLTIRKEGRCLNNCTGEDHGRCNEDGVCECAVSVRGGGGVCCELLLLRGGGVQCSFNVGVGKAANYLRTCSIMVRQLQLSACPCVQANWAGGDCSVSPTAACLAGSRRAVPRSDQHGTCWQECSCNSEGKECR